MPINAVIFDLDGTLLQTEKLKALSYAKAAVELCPYSLTEDDAIEAFKDFVGLSRQEVAEGLIERFNLHDLAQKRQAEFGVSTAWQAFVQVRLKYYAELIDDPSVLHDNQWSHNMDLLFMARQRGCKIGLATMSHCEQVTRILNILNLQEQFDFVATRDDVEHGKPDPEIYFLVSAHLGVPPDETLVLEDSPSGVQAALNAGMNVIAVSTPFTKQGLHELETLNPHWIVDNPQNDLLERVREFMADF